MDGLREDVAMGEPVLDTAQHEAPVDKEQSQKSYWSIDFATTFGAVAYYDGKTIHAADQWKDDQFLYVRRKTDSVPLVIKYEPNPAFGWTIYQLQRKPKHSIHHEDATIVQHAKLWLDDSPSTQSFRNELEPKINQLLQDGAIQKGGDVARDSVAMMLAQARRCVIDRGIIMGNEDPEFVLTVSAGWSFQSHTRLLAVLTEAVERTFGMDKTYIKNHRYLVAEPAAAATQILNDHPGRLKVGQICMAIDAGGGTIDVVGYRITSVWPLKFEEVCTPSGANCSSYFLNQGLQKMAREVLRDALPTNALPAGMTIDGVIRAKVTNSFETQIKRDVHFEGIPEFDFSISEIDPAYKSPNISQSHVLRQKTAEFVAEKQRKDERLMLLQPADNGEVAVAKGGLMRYFDKDRAPERYMRASIGYVQIIGVPWAGDDVPDDEYFEAHPQFLPLKHQQPFIGHDGYWYFTENLKWPREKGERIETIEYVSSHLFTDKSHKWVHYESIFISYDTSRD